MSFTADSKSINKSPASAISVENKSSVNSLRSVSTRGSDYSNLTTSSAASKDDNITFNPYANKKSRVRVAEDIDDSKVFRKTAPNSPLTKEKISKAFTENNDSNSKSPPIMEHFSSNATFDSDDEISDTLAGKQNKGCSIRYNSNCRPRYSYPLESINWTKCNIKNWYKPNSTQYNKYKVYCKSTKKRNYSKNISVGVKMMHKKMPYIWKFLNKQTQKKMIKLANLPIDLININPNSKNPNYKKKMTTIKNILNK